jgi:hypothetical protein
MSTFESNMVRYLDNRKMAIPKITGMN